MIWIKTPTIILRLFQLRVAATSQTRQLVPKEVKIIISFVQLRQAGSRPALAARVLKQRSRRTAPRVIPIALIVRLTPMHLVLDSTSGAEGEGLSNLKLIGTSDFFFPRPASHLQHPEARRVLRDCGGWRWGIGRVRSVHELHHCEHNSRSRWLWQCGDWLNGWFES